MSGDFSRLRLFFASYNSSHESQRHLFAPVSSSGFANDFMHDVNSVVGTEPPRSRSAAEGGAVKVVSNAAFI